jgi:hypothetical protein
MYQAKQLFSTEDKLANSGALNDNCLRKGLFCLHKVTRMMDSFEETFSLLPFLWFFGVFFSGAGIIFELKCSQNEWTTVQLATLLFPAFVQNIQLMFIVIDMESRHRRMKETFAPKIKSILSTATLSGHELVLKQTLISQMEEIFDRKLTGFGFFSLDKSFLLSFIASFITFTALFIDLA